MKIFRLIWSLVFFVSLPLHAEDRGNWVEDYVTATKLASEQKRRIFVLFTNSTICAPCRTLKESVLTKNEFLDYADKNLVLLKIDYAPYHDKEHKKELSEIEAEKKVPKELWMNGRGPWPYLFVLSPTREVIFSGTAVDTTRATVENYLKFLDGLK